MQDPANIPEEVMCHEEEMKQESTVFQFQSIYTPPSLESVSSGTSAVCEHGRKEGRQRIGGHAGKENLGKRIWEGKWLRTEIWQEPLVPISMDMAEVVAAAADAVVVEAADMSILSCRGRK
jgi:hypothetical protein